MDHQALSPSRESDFQSLSHVPVRLTVFFLSPHCGFYLILIPSVWAFQDRSVLRNWKSKNPNNWQGGETRRISDFWLCKSAIWAECSRNSWSLFHVASAGIAQKPEGEIKGATHLQRGCWLELEQTGSPCALSASAWHEGWVREQPSQKDEAETVSPFMAWAWKSCSISARVTGKPRFKRRRYGSHFLMKGVAALHFKRVWGTGYLLACHLGKYDPPGALINMHYEFINTELVN